MPLPAALDTARTELLRRAFAHPTPPGTAAGTAPGTAAGTAAADGAGADAGDGPDAATPGPVAHDSPPAPTPPAGLAGRAKRIARRAMGRAGGRARDRFDRAVRARIAEDTRDLAADAHRSLASLRTLEEQVDGLRTPLLDRQLDHNITAVNLELLKGEVRALQARLEEFGQAVAPATGLDGVPVRMAELRERLSRLDRNVRALTAGASANSAGGTSAGRPGAGGTSAPSAPPAGGDGDLAALFDYAGFERRFRGSPEAVLDVLVGRYGELLSASGPVLDIGCGRGELVEWLAARGVEAVGIDTEPSTVADAQARGVDVRLADALTHLAAQPDGSLGAIVSFHVLEHLELTDILRLLDLAATKLRPGGVLVAETPNPATVIVLSNSYILDPTHVRPLHPSLLAFLCESAGFRSVELRFHAPASDYQLPLVDDPDAPEWVGQLNAALTRLNDVLFGPQEYAVLARTPTD